MDAERMASKRHGGTHAMRGVAQRASRVGAERCRAQRMEAMLTASAAGGGHAARWVATGLHPPERGGAVEAGGDDRSGRHPQPQWRLCICRVQTRGSERGRARSAASVRSMAAVVLSPGAATSTAKVSGATMAKKSNAAAITADGNSHHVANPPPPPAVEQIPAGKEDGSEARDRKAEQLKALTTMLLNEATDRRVQVALDGVSAAADALTGAEHAVA
ncbi:hypothetical protein ACP4OV_021060 [Aristida adscensionis]